MPNVQVLRADLISVLENLRPHFAEADFLIGAIREWLDEPSLLDLAELLESAAETADADTKAKMLASAMDFVRERREKEEKERSDELAMAEDRIDIDFP